MNPDNRTTVSTSEPAGTVARKRSRSRIDAGSFRGRQTRHHQLGTLAAEQHIHSMVWSKFRERVEDEIEAGNIQLASLVVFVGGEQVSKDRQRSETLVVESYIDGRQGSTKRAGLTEDIFRATWATCGCTLLQLCFGRKHLSVDCAISQW